MDVLDLFSGIGAFSLGLERAGMHTVAFCEIDPYCRRVLARHWPEVPCYDDVRSLTAERLRADGISVDVICGGFPCQDISIAGRGAGIGGERSGLWREFARIIGEVRPRYVIVENVAALLGRGMGDVLGDLASLGYDAEWHCIPAAAVGAPHIRDRVWIIAYTDSWRCGQRPDEQHQSNGAAGDVAYATSGESGERPDADSKRRRSREAQQAGMGCGGVADAISEGLEGRAGLASDIAYQLPATERGGEVRDAGWIEAARHQRIVGTPGQSDWWATEPDVGRVAHGVSNRVDRLRALGNSLVPQIPELIGRAILRH